MPKQKDLKRLVRTRMEKTGEAYTAARLQVIRKKEEPKPKVDLAKIAGMSDAVVEEKTGRNWAQWTELLDAQRAMDKPHREITQLVSSLGTPDWWTQMVTVGYERIRGLRDKGQRRGGAYEAGKSRTFNVPVETLFEAFANARKRKRWLPVKITVRTSTAPKSMRVTWDDGTPVELMFLSKGAAKSSVAVTHQKLPDRAAVEVAKKSWGEHLDRLGEMLAS
jgi:hypothetical protein